MRVFVNSLPKSGTNLLEKLVRLLDFKHSGRSLASTSILGRWNIVKSVLRQDHFRGLSVPVGLEYPVSVSVSWLDKVLDIPDGSYISGHAAYSEQLDYLVQQHKMPVLQIYRDPRAVLLSWARFVAEEQVSWYPLHNFFKSMELEERILFLLHGGYANGIYHSSFREILQRSSGWLLSDNTFIVRFEDIIGAQGGGDDVLQRQVLIRILDFLQIPSNNDLVNRLQASLYGGTKTFRSGQVDSWRNLPPRVLAQISEHLSGCKIVETLGYSL